MRAVFRASWTTATADESMRPTRVKSRRIVSTSPRCASDASVASSDGVVATTRSPCNRTTVVLPDLSIAASAIHRRWCKNSATRLEVQLLTGDGHVDHQATAWNHEHRDAVAERRGCG